MTSYSRNPIGYEYEETDYVFWLNSEYSYKLSVNTYHIKPIRFLIKGNTLDGIDINIKVDSKKFGLIGSAQIQNLLEASENNCIEIKEDEHIKQELFKTDICSIFDLTIDDINDPWCLCTFYVACYSDEPGTWETNVLINVNDEEWCPITVGAELVDETEELIINGENVGISLPKDIIRAIYQSNVFAEYPDERLFAQKMKELLMNFMNIKGEEGNYRSALNALKWFGWGDKLTVYKLLHTDNEIIDQYVRDKFEIINDVLYSYKNFRNDALLAVDLPIDYMGEEEPFDFSKTFWGENKPEIKSYFDKDVIVHYDEGDIDFHRNYFDHTFEELGLKLCLLKYYYEKYFLPIHMHLNSLSLSRKVWTNDIKMITQCSPKMTAPCVFIKDSSISVKFPPVNTLYFHAASVLVDDNFNSFSFSQAEQDDPNVNLYSIYDTLIEVPIKFISENKNQYYDAILTLYKDNTVIHQRNFQFTQTDDYNYIEFIIHPKTLNRYLNVPKFNINNWLASSYKIELYVNGNNYEYEFKLAMPEMNLCMGTLEYKYDERFKQLDDSLEFQSYMHIPGLVTINNIDIIDDLYFFKDSLEEYVNKYYKSSVNIMNYKYLNRCHLYNIKKNGNEIGYNIENAEKTFEINLGDSTFTAVYDTTIYNEFFGENGLQITGSEPFEYDAFLMIEANYTRPKTIKYGKWYLVLISKDTIGNHLESEIQAPTVTLNRYDFEYVRSDNKFLVNRFVLKDRDDVESENYGTYHFSDNDLIAFYLKSNGKLPYKIGLATKWEIKPFSIGMSSASKTESPNEIAIFGVGGTNFRYERGYYTVTCRYSLDDYLQHSMSKTAKFRID